MRWMFAFVVTGLTAQAVAEPLVAPKPSDVDVEISPGHSAHGEAFNEGPRQAAVLMGNTGDISFPVSSKVPRVRQFIEQGIGQLHGYWSFEAERSFRQAAKLDPNCAMAYWGMAMANSSNKKRALGILKKAKAKLKYADDRERRYIAALDAKLTGKGSSSARAKNYVGQLEQLAKKYDWDTEAWAIYGHALYKNRSRLKKKYEDVDAVLKKVIKRNPLHPAHHFRIHLWDYKGPKNVLDSAALLGNGSPGVAHMWHMPGHIYSRLKRYEDAVWQQEASARTDHAQMIRYQVMPDQIHNFAHNNEWLIRNLIYLGRWRDALDLAKNMVELPQHPKWNASTKRKSAYYGRTRLFDVLRYYELWNETITCCENGRLEPTAKESEQIKRLRYLGIAYAEIGRDDKAEDVVQELEKRLAKIAKATKPKGKSTRRRRSSSSKSSIEQAIAAINGHIRLFDGKPKEALPLLKKGREDKLIIARVQSLSGDHKTAIKTAESEAKRRVNQTRPLAFLVEFLHRSGDKKRAKAEFDKLRKLSGSIHFGSPVFDRLASVAADLGFAKDWRIAYRRPKDFGKRPPIESLGPFRWSPPTAKTWTHEDKDGRRFSLNTYKGRPVVVVFYLGFGCLHCAEQIKELCPRYEEFKKAGIEVVAISSEDRDQLRTARENFTKTRIPFPLLADPGLKSFRRYRVFDDFEDVPLHGTFLIDAQGYIRWQDISYEPFMDLSFLLKESKRLLKFEQPRPAIMAPRPGGHTTTRPHVVAKPALP